MQGDSNIPHVPWSRNLVSNPQTVTTKNPTDWQINNYKMRQVALDSRRKAISESNLGNGGKVEGVEDDSWDSQSDPGSVSSTKSTRFGKKYSKSEEIDGSSSEHKIKQPVSGIGRDKKVQPLRRKALRNKVAEKGNEEFIVEIPVEDKKIAAGDVPITSCPKYVHTYFDFVYYCCLTPNKWDKTASYEQTKVHIALSIIQKVIYCYISIMATLSSFNAIKYQFINFLDERTLHQLIDVGYFMVGCGIHWYTTYYFVFRQDNILKLLQIWDDYHKTYFEDDQVGKRSDIPWLPTITGIVTITMSVIKAILYTDPEHWSYEGLLLENSENTAYCIFLWKPDHLYSDSFKDDYGTNLNWVTYTMGIVGLMATICWNLFVDIFKDLLIWTAFVNKHHMLRFGNKINESIMQKKATGKNSEEIDDHCWKAYREVIEVNSVTNSTFGVIFLINHLHSFLVFSYWLTEVLNKQATLRVLLLVGYNVGKGIFSYFPARQASGENDTCRKWVQSLPTQTERFCVDDTPYSKEVMLMELEKEPLGLGRGKVHINEFLISFITLVISLFCFLLNINPKDEEETFIY